MRRLALILALAMALAGCSGSGPVPSAPTADAVTTTTWDREAEEAAVIAAYLAQLDAFYLAADPPDPHHPALAETSTGPLLEGVRARLADLKARGVGIRKGEATVNRPRVARLTRWAAVIVDCNVDGDIQFDLTSGSVVDDSVLYGRVTARTVRTTNGWLVESRTVEDLEAACES